MGSSHLGDQGSGSRSGSSRRGKKGAADKGPKQPQRGLGIAQLEKIRLHNQMTGGAPLPSSLHGPTTPHKFLLRSKEDASSEINFSSSPTTSFCASTSSSPTYVCHPTNILMRHGDMESRDEMQGDQSPSSSTFIRTLMGHCNTTAQPLHRAQPAVTLPLLRQTMEDDWVPRSRRGRSPAGYCDSMCSSSQNSDSSDAQELDLELKLSL